MRCVLVKLPLVTPPPRAPRRVVRQRNARCRNPEHRRRASLASRPATSRETSRDIFTSFNQIWVFWTIFLKLPFKVTLRDFEITKLYHHLVDGVVTVEFLSVRWKENVHANFLQNVFNGKMKIELKLKRSKKFYSNFVKNETYIYLCSHMKLNWIFM